MDERIIPCAKGYEPLCGTVAVGEFCGETSTNNRTRLISVANSQPQNIRRI